MILSEHATGVVEQGILQYGVPSSFADKPVSSPHVCRVDVAPISVCPKASKFENAD